MEEFPHQPIKLRLMGKCAFPASQSTAVILSGREKDRGEWAGPHSPLLTESRRGVAVQLLVEALPLLLPPPYVMLIYAHPEMCPTPTPLSSTDSQECLGGSSGGWGRMLMEAARRNTLVVPNEDKDNARKRKQSNKQPWGAKQVSISLMRFANRFLNLTKQDLYSLALRMMTTTFPQAWDTSTFPKAWLLQIAM